MSTKVELSIDDFVAGLDALPADEFAQRCTDYVNAHAIDAATLVPYTFFKDRHYTRNLVRRTDLFQVLCICWEVGQSSPAHNHTDQECWMLVAKGQLEAQNFKCVGRDDEAGTCALEPTTCATITRDTPCAVDTDEPIHDVRNTCGERAISVHIYSLPFDTCEVYCLKSGTYKVIELSNFSELGEICQ